MTSEAILVTPTAPERDAAGENFERGLVGTAGEKAPCNFGRRRTRRWRQIARQSFAIGACVKLRKLWLIILGKR